jgi:hypothetical protein
MPQAIPVALAVGASAAGAGAAAGGITIAGVVLSSTALTAISVGLSVAGALATTLLAETPDKPRMQDGDVSIKQAIPPRTRMYGRQRLGGVYLYYDSTPDGDLKTLVCHAAHEVDDSTEGNPNPEEDWLNDERVQLDEGGQVTDDPWWQPGTGFGGDDGHSVVVIQHYLGSPTQVIPSFDEKWTAEHKAHGLCCAYVKYADLKDEDQIKAFPSGPPPYRAVLRGAKVYDPRTAQDPEDEATWAWSDNAALVLLDYLTRLEQGVPVGFGVPLTTRIDLASFAASADICDQAIPIKIEGEVVGTEKRWRSWGAYELTEDKKAVLQDLLDACGGRLIQGPHGRRRAVSRDGRGRLHGPDRCASGVRHPDRGAHPRMGPEPGKAGDRAHQRGAGDLCQPGMGMGGDRGRHSAGHGRPGAQRRREQPSQASVRAVREPGPARGARSPPARQSEPRRPHPDDAGRARRLGRALDPSRHRRARH